MPCAVRTEHLPPLRGGYVTLKNGNEYGEVGKEPLCARDNKGRSSASHGSEESCALQPNIPWKDLNR